MPYYVRWNNGTAEYFIHSFCRLQILTWHCWKDCFFIDKAFFCWYSTEWESLPSISWIRWFVGLSRVCYCFFRYSIHSTFALLFLKYKMDWPLKCVHNKKVDLLFFTTVLLRLSTYCSFENKLFLALLGNLKFCTVFEYNLIHGLGTHALWYILQFH